MIHLLLPLIYLAFISLGLPDALLGAAWPAMYPELDVPVSAAGIVSMIIALGTVVSSLMSARLTWRLGTGRITALSVALTAAALFGFSVTRSFWGLCLWAVPYGLGAGSVDAALNNYVALHYESRHMSWLHCMWGVGATAGPYLMGAALTGGAGWNAGYRWICLVQVALTAILVASLPLWKRRGEKDADAAAGSAQPQPARVAQPRRALTLREVIGIPGAKEIMLCFFCYSAVEQTANLWSASYLALSRGVSVEAAAGFASMFFVGITVGRGLSGFLAMRLSDAQMIRLGQALIGAGVVALLLPGGAVTAFAGLVLVGLGCAPIYPCIIHSTPAHFGAERSQALIGVQMASAYVGTCVMPPLFGLLASAFSSALLPLYLAAALAVMVVMHERLERGADGAGFSPRELFSPRASLSPALAKVRRKFDN